MALVLVVPLLILLYFVFVVGTATISRQLSSGFTAWLRDAGVVGRYLGGIAADVAVRLTRWITHSVGEVFTDAERLAVAWFSGLYQWAALAVGQALLWPIELFKLQWWLVTKAIPYAIQAAEHGVTSGVKWVTRELPIVKKFVYKLPKLSRAMATALVTAAFAQWVRPYLSAMKWLLTHIYALQHAIPNAIPSPRAPAIPNLRKLVNKWTRTWLLGAGLAVLVAALGRIGLGRLRCSNVKRTLPRICGMDSNLLESLLADSLLIVGSISIVALTEECQRVLPVIGWGVGGFVREAGTEWKDVPRETLDEVLSLIPGI